MSTIKMTNLGLCKIHLLWLGNSDIGSVQECLCNPNSLVLVAKFVDPNVGSEIYKISPSP